MKQVIQPFKTSGEESRVALPSGARAVNIACGTRTAPGWINLDNSPNARLSKLPWLRRTLWRLGVLSDVHYNVDWPDSITIHDARKKLPFEDASVDYVYTSHYLEHNTLEGGRRLISDIFRVLKPGGLLRVVVPDLAIGARLYLRALDRDPADSKAAQKFLEWMQLGRQGVRDPHLWMYDAPSLGALLTAGGFVNVVVCDCKKGRVPDCDILDSRPEESLYIEAEKP